MMTSTFDFVCFDDRGEPIGTETRDAPSEAAAKAIAGRLAKKNNGPVDLARSGDEDWSERYITTASPSEFHSTGFRFERLDG